MEIKHALSEDAPKIAALWYEGWHDAHSDIVPPDLTALRTKGEFEARTLTHLKQTQVAWIDGEIAGFFMLDRDEIYQFYVGSAHRNTGVGPALLKVAEDALGEGLKWLACSVGNERAAHFYEKCGWIQSGITPYEVETDEGPLTVEVWRYEKRIGLPDWQ